MDYVSLWVTWVYGLRESMGYVKNEYDDCLYYKRDGKNNSWVLTWEDDLLVIGNSGFDDVKCMLQKNIYSVQDEDMFIYLGVSYIKRPLTQSLYMNQIGSIQALLDKYKINISPRYRTPYDHTSFFCGRYSITFM